MRKFVLIIRRVVACSGYLAAYVFLPGLILVSLLDLIARRFFSYSSTPIQELAWHFFFACAMFGMGYAYLRDRHVRVDVFRDRISSTARTKLERYLLLFLLLPVALIMVGFGAWMTWISFHQGEGSRAALGLSARWIVKSALPIGALLLFLAGLYRLFHPFGSDEGDR